MVRKTSKKKKEESMGNRLQRLRERANLSQPELAKLAHVPLGTLRSIEQDRRTPRFDTVVTLADALNVSLDEVAGRRDFASSTSDD